MRKVILLLSCLLFLLPVLACRRPASPPVVLKLVFRGDLSEIETIVNTVTLFEKANPGINVQLSCPEFYMESLIALSNEETCPDVAFVEVHDFLKFRDKGMFYDLKSFVAKDNDFDLSTYVPSILAQFAWQNQLLVIPRDVAPICSIYYNQDMFDAAKIPYPQDNWHWKEFLDTARRLTQYNAHGDILVYGFVDDWPLWDSFLLSNGGHYVDNPEHPSRFGLDSPQCIEALQFRQDLIYKYRVMPGGRIGSMADCFSSGKAAMFLGGIWKTTVLKDTIKFRWDVVLFPQGPSGPRHFPAGGSGYALMKHTKHPQEAWRLLKFLAGKPGQIELAKSSLCQPADMTIAHSKYFLDGMPRNKGIFIKALPDAEFMPLDASWSDFLNLKLNPAMGWIWAGNEPAGTILKRVVKEGNEMFFKNKRH
jgi:multiple sugar transport system substrate-binding protein